MKKKRFLWSVALLLSLLLMFSVSGEAGWKNYSGGRKKYYVTATKSYVKKSWKEIKGKWYYFDKKGWMKTGRFKVGSNYFYVKKSTGRVVNKKIGSYYYGKNGAMMKNAWAKSGKYTFYFGKNGKFVTGRFKVDGNIYYCYKKTGMAKNKKIGDFYYGSDGAAAKKKWVGDYYYGSNGRAKYGQITVAGKTYYVDEKQGKMTSLWIDKHYYGEDGVMATEQWVNESYVDANGNITKGDKNPKNPPSESDIQLLAAITYLESGNQSYYGKQCVASVVVNRVNSKKFPDTLHKVIYQSGQFQPACHVKSVLNGTYKVNKKSWKECLKAAEDILTNGSVLKGYYFFNIYSGKLKIGDHYFS